MDGSLIQLKRILGANHNKVIISAPMGKVSKLRPCIKLHHRIRPITIRCYLHELSENEKQKKKNQKLRLNEKNHSKKNKRRIFGGKTSTSHKSHAILFLIPHSRPYHCKAGHRELHQSMVTITPKHLHSNQYT